MRNFLIRFFALSYETRVLGTDIGKSGKYPRAVIPCLIAFFCSVYLSLYSGDQTIFLMLSWIPFSITVWLGFPWIGYGYFGKDPITYIELRSKNQKWQYLNKLPSTGIKDKSYPEGFRYQEQYKVLEKWHKEKLNNSSNVNPVLGVLPFVILILGTYIAYLIFDAGYGYI